MRNKKKFLSVITMTASLVFVFCFVSQAVAVRGVSDDKIQVGIISDLTGPTSNTCSIIGAGMDYYFRYINSKGGVHGRKFDVHIGNDEYNVDKAIFEFKRLVKTKNAFMIVGPHNTGGILSIKPVGEKLKVPQIVMSRTDSIVFPPGKYLFLSSAPASFGVDVIFDYIFHDLKMKNPKIAIVYPNIRYGKLGLKMAQKRAKFYNTELIPIVMGLRDTNATSQVMRLKKLKADVVILYHIPKSSAIFMKDANSYGYRPFYLGNYNSTAEDTIRMAGKEMCEKFVGFTAYAAGYQDIPGAALFKEIKKLFPKLNPQRTEYSTGFVMAKIAVEGFKRAGRNFTIDSYIKALESIKNLDMQGLVAPVSYGPGVRYSSKGVQLWATDMTQNNRLKPVGGVRVPRKTP